VPETGSSSSTAGVDSDGTINAAELRRTHRQTSFRTMSSSLQTNQPLFMLKRHFTQEALNFTLRRTETNSYFEEVDNVETETHRHGYFRRSDQLILNETNLHMWEEELTLRQVADEVKAFRCNG
jgi:hypothetical protein